MRNNLIFLALIFFVFGLSHLHAQSLEGDSWQVVKEQGYGQITVHYLPVGKFSYVNEDGELTGVEIDIFKYFVNYVENSRDVELEVNWVEAKDNFPGFYDNIQKAGNGVFGLGTVSILPERKDNVLFSPPYINNLVVLVSHNSVPELQSLDEADQIFDNMEGIIVPETNVEEWMNEFKRKYMPDLTFKTVSSQLDAIELIKSEDKRYFSYLDLSIFWPQKQNGAPIKRHKVGDLKSDKFGFIMPLESDWKPLIDEFFELGSGFRSNPAYQQILIKHLGPEFANMLRIARTSKN